MDKGHVSTEQETLLGACGIKEGSHGQEMMT